MLDCQSVYLFSIPLLLFGLSALLCGHCTIAFHKYYAYFHMILYRTVITMASSIVMIMHRFTYSAAMDARTNNYHRSTVTYSTNVLASFWANNKSNLRQLATGRSMWANVIHIAHIRITYNLWIYLVQVPHSICLHTFCLLFVT